MRAGEVQNEIGLLKASLKGNTKAFEAIVERYQSLVCAITFSATADLEKSEELAQKAFIKAWTNLAQLQDLTKFRAWFRSIIRNIITDYLRQKKRDIVTHAEPIDKIENIPSEGFKPIEKVINAEQQAVVTQALEQIPPRYREPLVLFYRQEQSIRQVAEQLDLSVDVVKTRVSRGRKMLKQQVATMVETTVSRTGPGKAFTTAVIASIAGIAVKGTGTAAAATTAASVAGSAGVAASIMSSIAAKIITAAAVIAIGAGTVVTYKHVTKLPEQNPNPPRAEAIVQKQAEKHSLHGKQKNEKNTSFDKATTVSKPAEQQKTSSPKNDSSESQKQSVAQLVNSHLDKQKKPETGVSGIIIDKANFQPIKGAEIFYGSPRKPKASFVTDVNGHYEFLNMEPRQRQFFYIVAKNYTSRRITLDIIKNKIYKDFKIELTRGSKVAGIIYDQNEKPVKGASVSTFYFTNHPVVTDVNGSFEIDGLDPAWEQYSLHVTHPDYPACSTSFSPANAGETAWKDVALKPGVTICGQVANSQGDPVPKATVGNTTSSCMWNCIEAKTDQDGKYELKNVEVGELVLWAVAKGYPPYVERFDLNGSEAKETINIQLANPVPLHGKIIDKQGNPVPGVNVSIREYKGVRNLPSCWSKSDAQGKFTLLNTPPEGKVIIEVYANFVPNLRPELETGLEDEYVIEVDRAGKIYGRVINDKTGEPIEKFNVKLTFSKKGSKPGWGYSATWNREGHNFNSPKGFFDTGRENIPIDAEYSVTVYAEGFDPLTIDPVVVQPINNEPNRIEFRLETATAIAGRVVDSNGAPIAGARVRCFSESNKLNYGEHWDDRDTTVTNGKGEFVLSAVGSGKCGICITREMFAPCIITSLLFPEDVNELNEIVLQAGCDVFGKVIDDGKAVANASIKCEIFRQELSGSNMGQIRFSATTGLDGFYEFLDLPEGEVSVRFSSVSGASRTGNYNFCSKKIRLKAGHSVELNFGDEPGFTINGVVRAGKNLLHNAQLTITLNNSVSKMVATNVKGEFELKGIPMGVYTLHTHYDKKQGLKSSPDRWLSARREINVEDDVELDIDLGDGSISGYVPGQFADEDDLHIAAKRLVEKRIGNNIISLKWDYARQAVINTDGSFVCSNLNVGKYYLLLTTKNETLGISDVFELGESENLENVTFNTGNSILHICIVDSQTKMGIPGAKFAVKNDLDAVFYSRRLIPENDKSGMVTDHKGIAEFTDLPKGKYSVWVQTPGYLKSESRWVNLDGGKNSKRITVEVELAAIVQFEMSEELEKRMIADTVYLRCRVTNINTNESVPMVGLYGVDEEYTVYLLPKEYTNQPQSSLKLPEGWYDIRYRLYQDRKGGLSYKINPPLFERIVNVELNRAETKIITISE